MSVAGVDHRAAKAPGREVGQPHELRDTVGYFAATGQRGFYSEVVLAFTADAGRDPYHVPLLLSPYAYSTYRGS